MPKPRILIVDDEQNARSALRTLLSDEGYDIAEAANGEEGFSRLQELAPDVVLADVRMPRIDGLSLLRKAKEIGSGATFVMMTAFASIEAAVEAMKAGAENYLVKPLDVGAVLVFLQKALEKRRLVQEAETLRERVRERFRLEGMVGDAPELRAVYDVVRQAAGPFVKVSCAALSETLLESELFGHERGSFTGALGRKEGRLELADSGTLFLDEIGEISPTVQVKLLRALQTREFERVGGTQTIKVDVRVVAATNRDLLGEVNAGRFREDLFYRLNVVAVTLPPMRKRKADIPALAAHFIEKYAKSYGKEIEGLAPGTLNALLSHDWPGNVRELENAIERAVVLCKGSQLTADDLPATFRGPRPRARDIAGLIPGASFSEIEREAILRTLELVDGSTTRAAEMLGISVRKIQYRLKEYARDTPAATKDVGSSA
ncbi:MAG: transcriptional regulator [Gemmatimonadetes bacterium]|nr:MAG: transcriptional regulator [Gemmatimonadota bacterium]